MLSRVITFAVLGVIASLVPPTLSVQAAAPSVVLTSPDYPSAYWIPASPSNYTVSDRPVSYQVNMIVIHDIEGSFNSAITAFQDPTRAGSAHYVISRKGRIAQMVDESNIAWHAGNWDYNTRSIGIEHEGYANLYGSFTVAEYKASANLAASICSRWGVPMDRNHVIGHYQVPDPTNPLLFGGLEHHYDPGKYWNWTYYMSLARSYAGTLPSPPHMGPAPVAAIREGGVLVTWQPAQTCTRPITSYTIVGSPGGISLTVPASIHSVWIPGLTDGTAYSFTVTATNAQGHSTLSTNTAVPGLYCGSATLSASPSAPRPTGTLVRFTPTSTLCNTPQYAFWVRNPAGRWDLKRDYGSGSWTWNTSGLAAGLYQVEVWARQRGSAKAYDTFGVTTYSLTVSGCQNATLSPSLPSPQPPGTSVTFSATSTGCSSPQYQFWLLPPGGSWTIAQPYSSTATWLFDSSKYGGAVFQVGVWTRQAGATNTHDGFFVTTYWMDSGAGCVVSRLAPSVASPQILGAVITFTPLQTECSNQYKFWLLPPGGAWRVVQAYGVGSTWAWNTHGYAPGDYEVGVWEGSSSTPSVHESYAITTFTLEQSSCDSASLASDVTSPQAPGTSITFTASSVGCTSPQYEFWLLKPGGSWTVARSYGGASWLWATAGLAPGPYQVGVWALGAGSTAAHDAYFIGSYELAVPVCTAATIAANPASPGAAGTSVVFTATTSGCSAPRYEFLEQAPGGVWKVVQTWGTGSKFDWSSTGAPIGDYNFAVMALAAGSSQPYDSYAGTNFSISS